MPVDSALAARVEETVRRILRERADTPDIGMESRPAERNRLAERLRMLSEYQSGIGSRFSRVLKVTAREDGWHQLRASGLVAIGECPRRAASEPSEAGKRAWNDGPPYLQGEPGFFEVPGAIIALCKEWNLDRLLPLPTIDAELAKLAAERAECVARLESELDGFDRWQCAVVHGRIDAALPAVESHIVATVKERATTSG